MNRRVHRIADDDEGPELDVSDVVKGWQPPPRSSSPTTPSKPPPASIFQAAEQAAPRAKPAKVTVVVVKGVPLPPKARKNAFSDAYADLVRQVRQLKPDEHVELPHARAKVLQRKARRVGIATAVRKVDELLSGVWRL